jgi:hypothetical protein
VSLSAQARAEVLNRVLKDVRSTVGSNYDRFVELTADAAATFHDDLVNFEARVVEEIQQYFHDAFIDPSWPACPRHKRHPMWLRLTPHGLCWCCEMDDEAIARVGELDSLSTGRPVD